MRSFKVILFYFIYKFGGILVIFEVLGVFWLFFYVSRVFGQFRGFESILVIFLGLRGFWSFSEIWRVF